MNFKEKQAYVSLPSGSHYLPSTEHLSSLRKDFLGNDLYLDNSNSICIPNNDDEAESTPRQMLHECPVHYALQELHKMFLSLTLMPS